MSAGSPSGAAAPSSSSRRPSPRSPRPGVIRRARAERSKQRARGDRALRLGHQSCSSCAAADRQRPHRLAARRTLSRGAARRSHARTLDSGCDPRHPRPDSGRADQDPDAIPCSAGRCAPCRDTDGQRHHPAPRGGAAVPARSRLEPGVGRGEAADPGIVARVSRSSSHKGSAGALRGSEGGYHRRQCHREPALCVRQRLPDVPARVQSHDRRRLDARGATQQPARWPDSVYRGVIVTLGLNQAVGPVVGLAWAAFVVADPERLIWERTESSGPLGPVRRGSSHGRHPAGARRHGLLGPRSSTARARRDSRSAAPAPHGRRSRAPLSWHQGLRVIRSRTSTGCPRPGRHHGFCGGATPSGGHL